MLLRYAYEALRRRLGAGHLLPTQTELLGQLRFRPVVLGRGPHSRIELLLVNLSRFLILLAILYSNSFGHCASILLLF